MHFVYLSECVLTSFLFSKVSFHMNRTFLLNTAISRLQGLTNALRVSIYCWIVTGKFLALNGIFSNSCTAKGEGCHPVSYYQIFLRSDYIFTSTFRYMYVHIDTFYIFSKFFLQGLLSYDHFTEGTRGENHSLNFLLLSVLLNYNLCIWA